MCFVKSLRTGGELLFLFLLRLPIFVLKRVVRSINQLFNLTGFVEELRTSTNKICGKLQLTYNIIPS